ncbi:MAG TPA: tetratricopeptide repeat protein [Stellaceae bacterium]|nr:tetratricopeptide repeat protein [Stellaceae bacterium]
MPQTPLSAGEPARPRGDESRRFVPAAPVTFADTPVFVEPVAAGDSGRGRQRRPESVWRNVDLIEFEPVAEADAASAAAAAWEHAVGFDAMPTDDEVLSETSEVEAFQPDAPQVEAYQAEDYRRERSDRAAGDETAGDGPAGAVNPAAARADPGKMVPLVMGDAPAPRLRPPVSRRFARTLPVRRRSTAVRRALKIVAAGAAIVLIATFALQTSEHRPGTAGAMTPPDVAVPDAATARREDPIDLPPPRPADAPAETPAEQQAARTPDEVTASASHHAGPPGAVAPGPGASGSATTPRSDAAMRATYYLGRAMAGDAGAQYDVGVLYTLGEGVDRDPASAALWFRQAAENGNVAAQFNLGVCYDLGLGVPASPTEAVTWYRRAADRKDPRAAYNLAVAYDLGRGIPHDPVAAARWYHQAARQGIVPAMINFAILYEKGEGVQHSLPDAFAWYWAAGQRGDDAAAKRADELFATFDSADRRQAQIREAGAASSIRSPPNEPIIANPNRPEMRLGAVPVLKSGLPAPRTRVN